ncbi:protein O-mannosyl-transferase family [Kaistella rhinocerotis]|uniref:protein O-mannosyl-transferase family n=1 Tax=Kaistella rhinocerotis TaxID=3026437 RepID=UPI002553E890|nr:DUF2723 domain-containing protein [Kaistella sp. Ran72]
MEKYRNPALIFLIFLLIYVLGSFSKVPFGDCMPLVLDTELGVFIKRATPTSHFLYSNAAIFIKNITNLDAILVSRYLVIVAGAFVVMMVYKTVHLLTKKDWVSVVAAFVFGFSFTFWRNAEIVEVYTFNMVWISLLLHYLIKVFLTEKNRATHIIIASLLISVSLWAHIQNLFFLPSLLLMLIMFKDDRRIAFVSLLLPILSFALMIWLNSSQNLPAESIFKSGDKTWVSDTFKKDFVTYLKDFVKAFGYLLYNFNFFTVAGIFGIIMLFRTDLKLFWVISAAAVLIYGFATFYAVTDNYVFFLPFNYIFALSIGLGLSSFRNQNRVAQFAPACVLIPLIYFFTYKIVSEVPAAKNFDEAKSYKGGLRYYLLPWMTDNVGILEFTAEERTAPEAVTWMVKSSEEYIKILKSKGLTEGEIKAR